jgi:hypothetical protein
MELEYTGDYDYGMQEWGIKMECTGDYCMTMECKS